MAVISHHYTTSQRRTQGHFARTSSVGLLLSLAVLGIPVKANPLEPSTQLAQATGSSGNEFFLSPFRYVEPRSNTPSPSSDSTRPPRQQRIVELSNAGAYAQAGREGLALTEEEGTDDGLQLIIANSLAWSGRLQEATAVYRRITQEPLVDDAAVGMANILRWQGRDERAAPVYREILSKNPDHLDAKNGLELAEKELAPRTAVFFGKSADSSDVQSRTLMVTHRWRDDSGYRIFEVEGATMTESLPGAEAPLREVTARYQDVGIQLRPTLELTVPTSIKNSMFGNLQLHLENDAGQIDVGRINWGKYTSNANSLLNRDTATHVGLLLKHPFEMGDVAFKADYFNISDNNTIYTTDTKLTSAIRPFGSHIRPYMGIETRQAKNASPNYWSPTNGAGSLYGGLAGEWPWESWSTYAGIQAGLGIYGDAGASWMLSGGAKYWITSNYALSFNLWGMTSTRGSTEYRAHTANVVLEKIWR